MTINETWDLEPFFKGGSHSTELADFFGQLTADIADFSTVAPLPTLSTDNHAEWVTRIETLYDLSMRLGQTASFIECLVSQDVNDDYALQLQIKNDQLWTQLGTFWTQLSAQFAEQNDEAWQTLINQTSLKAINFHLHEKRALARQKMDTYTETLVNELANDGYHGWGRLYDLVSGDKQLQFQGETISLGQLKDRFHDDYNRTVRREGFALYEESWQSLSRVCSMALNYQAGFRLTLYKHRDWQSVLKEPLLFNRLQRETLDTMWQVIDAKSAKLLDFFAAKAKMMGEEKISWFDISAPVGNLERTYTYQQAGDFVVEALQGFNPDIAEFARMAIDKRWIEAEDRAGKRAGGYCTDFPINQETRIFMTFNGSYNGLLTLAHELGHSYHSWVMRDLPYGARHYSMTVAETASTFNELAVTDAALKATTDKDERISLLGSLLNDATSMLMDIRSRFEFEVAFFKAREKKSLSVDELNELMVTAQKRAFKDGLAQYHPWFWASKLHFYSTDYPFYNFPYTFGYLFSNGVYNQAIQEGPSFVQRYINLLRDTGSMSTETLAQTHLGVDLTKPEFWEMAVDRALARVDEFVALV